MKLHSQTYASPQPQCCFLFVYPTVNSPQQPQLPRFPSLAAQRAQDGGALLPSSEVHPCRERWGRAGGTRKAQTKARVALSLRYSCTCGN